jgi:hypothetical protein
LQKQQRENLLSVGHFSYRKVPLKIQTAVSRRRQRVSQEKDGLGLCLDRVDRRGGSACRWGWTLYLATTTPNPLQLQKAVSESSHTSWQIYGLGLAMPELLQWQVLNQWNSTQLNAE